MGSDFIINVSEADFEYEVLVYSQKAPVIVDFWAEWCIPCKTLGPLLESLAEEAQGGFRLAKVDVDENPNLATRYAVYSIPTVKVFQNREIKAEFSGVRTKPELRKFLRSIAPSQTDLLMEKGNSLMIMGHTNEAEQAFRQALNTSPVNPGARLGLAKCLLLQGHGRQSYELLANFPTSKNYNAAELLRPLAEAVAYQEETKHPESENPLDAAFYNAIRLVLRGNIEAALDGLLDILREDKRYRDGEVQRMIVALLELMGNHNPLTQQYRNELASILF